MTRFSVTIQPRSWVRTLFVVWLLIALHAAAPWWLAWVIVWIFTRGVKVWFAAEGRVTWRQD